VLSARTTLHVRPMGLWLSIAWLLRMRGMFSMPDGAIHYSARLERMQDAMKVMCNCAKLCYLLEESIFRLDTSS